MLLKFIILFVCLKSALSHSNGADDLACVNLTPQHGDNTPQTSPMPVQVIVPSTVRAGQLVTVTLLGSPGFIFRGFMIQGRTITTGIPVEQQGEFYLHHFDYSKMMILLFLVTGSFELTAGMRRMDCSALPPNSVATHIDNSNRASINLSWRAPSNFGAPFIVVNFHYSIVESFPVFWTNGVSTTNVFVDNS